MQNHDPGRSLSIGIVGGGLAGMAAATALVRNGATTTLFERSPTLGGRAAAIDDPKLGQPINLCKHVLMGCCSNAFHFARTIGAESAWKATRTLRFVDASGATYSFRASSLLPAPLHLGPALMALRFLPLKDRLHIARTILRLVRVRETDREQSTPTVGDWLRNEGASEASLRRFWSVILISALGETLERASLNAAAKVFRDGFIASRDAHVVYEADRSFAELHHERPLRWLRDAGVDVRLRADVRCVRAGESQATVQAGSLSRNYDAVILAVPWRNAAHLLRTAGVDDEELPFQRIAGSPITSVQFWSDRPLIESGHVVLPEAIGEWLFVRREQLHGDAVYHHELVASASRALRSRPKHELLADCVGELHDRLHVRTPVEPLHWRVVHSPNAVFSVTPENERLRPSSISPLANVFLAGDWTQTGWPATMEGAVRSGYQAAEAVLQSLTGDSVQCVRRDPSPAWLSRILL